MLNLFRRRRGSNRNRSSQHYFYLKVKQVIQETADAISIVFEPPEGGMAYQAGQFLTLIADIEGKEVRRSYSFCSTPGMDPDLVVTAKRVAGGLMSNYLADQVKAGDQIKVMEPMGHFTTQVVAENKRHLIFFGGGSGITPFMSLIKYVMHGEPDSIISLIYANRNTDSIIFKDQLEQLQSQYTGRFQAIHVLDEAPATWSGHVGLLNPTKLDELLATIPNWGLEKTEYWMCGPQAMMQIVENYLQQKAIPKARVLKESFTAPTADKDLSEESSENELTTREVTILYQGEEHKITVKPDSTILETGLDAGIDLPFSCQSGLCTACRCKLLSGEITMDEDEGLSEKEREEGYVLICVGHPLTDDVKLKVG